MTPAPEPGIVTRLLEELEVHGTTASELYLILLAIHGVTRALAALTAYLSPGAGPGF